MTENLQKKLPPYRALINSAARLTYEQLQAAHDGQPDSAMTPLMDNVVKAALRRVRGAWRGRGRTGNAGPEPARTQGQDLASRASRTSRKYVHLNSHSLVEEFMAGANEDAAASLEEMHSACVYRIHPEPPSKEKLDSIRDYAIGFGLQFPTILNRATICATCWPRPPTSPMST